MRTVALRLMIIGLSFCAGLLVFYMPERQYRSLPEVWLPAVNTKDVAGTLNLPIKSHRTEGKVFFSSMFSSGPEVIEMPSTQAIPSKCPNLFDTHSVQPSRCEANNSHGLKIYTISRQKTSLSVEAFMLRGRTLVAASGFYSKQDAYNYMSSLQEVARRDVNHHLGANNEAVKAAVIKIRDQKRQFLEAGAESYKHLPFDPVLPCILPAGWYQQLIRVSGRDPKHPDSMQVYYKKGSERTLSIEVVPGGKISLGDTCGPIPSSGVTVSCSKAPGQDFYSGGSNTGDSASWYIYRPIGNIVAILQIGAYGFAGRPVLLSNQDLAIQRTMAMSLRPVGKDRLKGAKFANNAFDQFPEVQP